MKIKVLSENRNLFRDWEEISKKNNQGKTVIIFVLAFKGTNPFLMNKNSKKNSKMPPSDKTISIEGIKRGGK
jgi:hypothetical protein